MIAGDIRQAIVAASPPPRMKIYFPGEVLLMRGDIVIVRAFRNEPLVRRVWEVTSQAVFICSEENFQALSAGEPGLWPVGFAREDVFCYDVDILNELTNKYESDPSLWQRLIPWSESLSRTSQIVTEPLFLEEDEEECSAGEDEEECSGVLAGKA